MYCKAYKIACMNAVLDKIQLTRLLNRLIQSITHVWNCETQLSIVQNYLLMNIRILEEKNNYESLFPSRF